MHPNDLDGHGRESFDRAMTTIRSMRPDEHEAMLAYAVAASIRYANTSDAGVLDTWASDLESTLRLHASPRYRAAVTELADRTPDLTGPGKSVREMFTALSLPGGATTEEMTQ